MPRKRPGALRAASEHAPRPIVEPGDMCRIDRLSLETSAAIHHAELLSDDLAVRPGRTASRLRIYREFLDQPGGVLLLAPSECPSCPGCEDLDVAVARSGLEAVRRVLPPWARKELTRLLAGLDADFRRRTLPSLPPRTTDRRGDPLPWWRLRAYQRP